MKTIKLHILILLSAVILFPSGMSLAHIFVHHHEKSCADHGQGHYHTKKYNCDFSLFFRTISFYDEIRGFEISVLSSFHENFQQYYQNHSSEIFRSYSLRGPPCFV
ncbi:MAG TPA: hypothetical protein VFM82_11220 [Flavobacteriaceae bacterium]|nr:hypothetical protein [Flavobacteriaceae bacterium]